MECIEINGKVINLEHVTHFESMRCENDNLWRVFAVLTNGSIVSLSKGFETERTAEGLVRGIRKEITSGLAVHRKTDNQYSDINRMDFLLRHSFVFDESKIHDVSFDLVRVKTREQIDKLMASEVESHFNHQGDFELPPVNLMRDE